MANYEGNLIKMLGGGVGGNLPDLYVASNPERELLVSLCYRNHDKLWCGESSLVCVLEGFCFQRNPSCDQDLTTLVSEQH